jgi:hypothetical protein
MTVEPLLNRSCRQSECLGQFDSIWSSEKLSARGIGDAHRQADQKRVRGFLFCVIQPRATADVEAICGRYTLPDPNFIRRMRIAATGFDAFLQRQRFHVAQDVVNPLNALEEIVGQMWLVRG